MSELEPLFGDAWREKLRLEQRAYRLSRTLTRLALSLLGAVLIAVLVGIGVLLVLVRGTQIEGSPSSKRIEHLSEQVNSCVNPKGACYKRGQEQQAGAVGALTQGTREAAAAAAACAARPRVHGYVQIKACVDRTLASQTRRR